MKDLRENCNYIIKDKNSNFVKKINIMEITKTTIVFADVESGYLHRERLLKEEFLKRWEILEIVLKN